MDRGDAIKQYFIGRRRAITVFRKAGMDSYPLPVQYDWLADYHHRKALLHDAFKTTVGSMKKSATAGTCLPARTWLGLVCSTFLPLTPLPRTPFDAPQRT